MAGTKIGGARAAATNKARDPNFYAKIGSIGGKLGRTGGFFANRELARIAGQKGGRRSKRQSLNPDQIEELLALRRKDPKRWSYIELALEFGVSHSTVARYLKERLAI